MDGFSKLKKYKTGVAPKWNYDTFKNMDNNIVLDKEVAQELNDTIKYLKTKLQAIKDRIDEDLTVSRKIADEDFERNGSGNPFYQGQIIELKNLKHFIEKYKEGSEL